MNNYNYNFHNRKKIHKPPPTHKPQWDSTPHHTNDFKLTPAQMIRRKNSLVSKNKDKAAEQWRLKQSKLINNSQQQLTILKAIQPQQKFKPKNLTQFIRQQKQQKLYQQQYQSQQSESQQEIQTNVEKTKKFLNTLERASNPKDIQTAISLLSGNQEIKKRREMRKEIQLAKKDFQSINEVDSTIKFMHEQLKKHISSIGQQSSLQKLESNKSQWYDDSGKKGLQFQKDQIVEVVNEESITDTFNYSQFYKEKSDNQIKVKQIQSNHEQYQEEQLLSFITQIQPQKQQKQIQFQNLRFQFFIKNNQQKENKTSFLNQQKVHFKQSQETFQEMPTYDKIKALLEKTRNQIESFKPLQYPKLKFEFPQLDQQPIPRKYRVQKHNVLLKTLTQMKARQAQNFSIKSYL